MPVSQSGYLNSSFTIYKKIKFNFSETFLNFLRNKVLAVVPVELDVYIQSGPKKFIHFLLINIFGINLNEISISGWVCNIMFSQQMAQALL